MPPVMSNNNRHLFFWVLNTCSISHFYIIFAVPKFCSVTVTMSDSDSEDPGSNPGRTTLKNEKPSNQRFEGFFVVREFRSYIFCFANYLLSIVLWFESFQVAANIALAIWPYLKIVQPGTKAKFIP